MSMGINHKPAPELCVPYRISENGKERAPLRLADLGDGHRLLYCFQSWCPGCHAAGFAALKKLVEDLSDHGFGFAAVQKVFEGGGINTPDKLLEMQDHYSLKIPFGHDPAAGRHPTLMEDFRTAGTPWLILNDPKGDVIFNDFRLDADRLIDALSHDNLVA